MSNERRQRRGPMGGHGPMGGAMMAGEKAKDFKGTVRKLLSYLSPYHIQIIIVLIFAALSTVFTILGPKILAKATDELANGLMRTITGSGAGIDFTYIGKIILLLAGLYLISAAFSYIQGYIMAGVSSKVSYDMRNQLMQKISRLPMSYFN